MFFLCLTATASPFSAAWPTCGRARSPWASAAPPHARRAFRPWPGLPPCGSGRPPDSPSPAAPRFASLGGWAGIRHSHPPPIKSPRPAWSSGTNLGSRLRATRRPGLPKEFPWDAPLLFALHSCGSPAPLCGPASILNRGRRMAIGRWKTGRSTRRPRARHDSLAANEWPQQS
jgi:hypothetical protein